MANDPKYNVRITFINGNGITLDCKGCGQIWLEPNHDYFFENSPIKFINYLAQLRRVGVTYKITEDKRGCYQTFDLSRYESGSPRNIISQLRGSRPISNKVEETPIVEETEEPVEETIEETPVEETVTKGAPGVPEVVETPEVNTPDADETEEETQSEEEEVTEETKEETTEPEVTEEEPVEEEPVDVDSLNKKDLIEYAHSLGLTEISDIYTKKEIKEAIAKLQEDK